MDTSGKIRTLNQNDARAPKPHAPEISVIMPAYNRRDVVVKSLRAYAQQNLDPARFEVIVSDDGSSDGTGEAVAAEQQSLAISIIYHWAPNGGANAARNAAMALARAPIVVIVNDDTIPVPGFLTQHLLAHEAHPQEQVAVLGRVVQSAEMPASLFADLHSDITWSQFEGKQELDWRSFFSGNLSLKRSFLDKHTEKNRPFLEGIRWHEDVELGERLRHHGLRLIYWEAALSHHYHYLDERQYLSVAEKDGRALAQWYKRRPDLAPELEVFGLYGPPPLRRAARHAIADAVLNGYGYSLALGAARLLAPVHKRTAQIIYRKLYQRQLRRAIARELNTPI